MFRKSKNLILTSALLLVGCSNGGNPTATTTPEQSLQKYSDITLDAGFDTFIQLQEYTDSIETFNEHFELVVDLFSYYNKLFDIYNTYDGINNVKTINDNAGIEPVVVDDALIDMLLEAKEFYELSNGEFDITMGSVLKIWHQYRDEGINANSDGEYGKTPSQEELENAAQYIGWEYIEINEDENTVYITDPNVSLDVGGIAKGYATERVALALGNFNSVGGSLNAGGNNRTLDDKIDGTPWRVRIQNPDGLERLVIVEASGIASFVTSGDYERYYISEDGNAYHHIIDPSTLYPATYYRSVSIITPDSGAADCLSTTLFTLSIEDGLKVIEAYRAAHDNVNCDVIWAMDNDKSQGYTNEKQAQGFTISWTDDITDAITFE